MKIRPLIQQTAATAILVASIRMLAFTLFLATFAASSFAAAINWTGNGTVAAPTDGNWDTTTANQWQTGASGSGNSVWVPADEATFGGIDGTYGINVPANLTVHQNITFNNSGYTLSNTTAPKTISFSAGGGIPTPTVAVAAGKTATIGTNVTLTLNATFILGGAGTLIIDNGGTVQITTGSTLSVDSNVTISVKSGGAFKMTATGTGGNAQIGASPGENSAVSVDGGTFSIAGTSQSILIGQKTNAIGTLTVNSGTVSLAAGNTTGALSVGATASPGGGTGTVNLNGGLLLVNHVITVPGNTSTFNFNGGTLKAVNGTFASTFMTNLTAANVESGGAVIDNNGFNIIIPQLLVNGGGVDGGLIVTNSGAAGSLTLTNANTYNGPTVVKSGAYFATTTRNTGVGSYTVNDGASLEVQVPVSGGQLAMSSLTEGTSGNLTNVFTLGANASTTTPAVAVSGALTLSGTVTVNVTGSGLTGPSTYLLASYGSVTGPGSFVAGTLPAVAGFTPSLVNTGTQLQLVYTAVSAGIKWGVGSGNWDTTTLNWLQLPSGVTPIAYTESSVVVFDDSASGSSPITVTLTGSHTPNTVTNNSTKNYIFAGSGFNITGAPLIKSGSSTLIIDNGSGNNFTTVTVNGGVVQVGNGDANGSLGSGGVVDNGTLAFNRSDSPAFANVVSGTGGVTQSGSGSVTLSGANSYSGSTTVSAGSLTTTTASTGVGAFMVADGATLGVQVAASGQSLTNSSLTLGTSGNLTTVFTLGANGSTTVPVIQDNGVLNLNGTVTVNVTGTLSAGTYTLISYGSTSGSGSFVLGSAPAVATNTVALVNTGTQLQLVYTPFSTLTWDSGNTNDGGNIEAGNGIWDKISSNLVWNTGSLNIGWQDTVQGIFGGSDGTWAINLATNVAPSSIVFNNSGYTFTSAVPQTINFSQAGSASFANVLFNTAGTNTIGTNVTMGCVATYILNGTGGTLIVDNGGAIVESNSSTVNIDGSLTVSVKTGGIFKSTYAGTSGTGNLQVGAIIGDNSTLSVDGGTVSLAGTNNMGIGIGTVVGAVGTLTINSGTVSQSALNPVKVLTLAAAASSTGTVNLNGGLLAVTCVTNGPNGTATFNFNGGTLRAVNGAFASGFMNLPVNIGSATANVESGGAVIDNNGFNITIGQPLVNGGGTDGGLTSLGAGSLNLTAANTYNGNTVVNAGSLILSGSGSVSSSAGIVVAGGATFDVSATTFALVSGQVLSNSTSTATLNGSVDASVGTVSLTYASGTPSFAVTNGTLTLALGTTFKVNNTGSALTGGNYKLVATNATGLVSGTLPSVSVGGSGLVAGATASLQIISSELYLVVSGGTPPTPHITGISLSGTTLNLTATNGAANGSYVLLQSTNVALPLSQWTPVLTNNFDSSGNLNLSTNIVNPSVQQQFYILLQ